MDHAASDSTSALRAAPTFPLLSLPPELVIHTIDQISSPSTLHALAQTSRLFLPLARHAYANLQQDYFFVFSPTARQPEQRAASVARLKRVAVGSVERYVVRMRTKDYRELRESGLFCLLNADPPEEAYGLDGEQWDDLFPPGVEPVGITTAGEYWKGEFWETVRCALGMGLAAFLGFVEVW